MTELNDWVHQYSGKVRELYLPAASNPLASLSANEQPILIVASDRVSAFDYVLSPAIPNKGAILNRLSLWWFEQLSSFKNQLYSDQSLIPSELGDRALLVKNLKMYPIEAVVRGYLSGSGWVEYQQSQSVCGVELPAGLQDGDRLPEPIYTPAWKAPQGEHDRNITFAETVELVGPETAEAIKTTALAIYNQASETAEAKGLILADTKFEFGADPVSGELTLGDEVLTSDSSRYWDLASWQQNRSTTSFDKQIIRNWLKANWDQTGTPPELPGEVVQKTLDQYLKLFELLTGKKF